MNSEIEKDKTVAKSSGNRMAALTILYGIVVVASFLIVLAIIIWILKKIFQPKKTKTAAPP